MRLTATLLRGHQIVGVATSSIPGLVPGEVRTVRFITGQLMEQHDEVRFQVDDAKPGTEPH